MWHAFQSILVFIIFGVIVACYIALSIFHLREIKQNKKLRKDNRELCEENQMVWADNSRLEEERKATAQKLKVAEHRHDHARKEYYQLLEFVMKRKIGEPSGSKPN